jgi:hypothetical protein
VLRSSRIFHRQKRTTLHTLPAGSATGQVLGTPGSDSWPPGTRSRMTLFFRP